MAKCKVITELVIINNKVDQCKVIIPTNCLRFQNCKYFLKKCLMLIYSSEIKEKKKTATQSLRKWEPLANICSEAQ